MPSPSPPEFFVDRSLGVTFTAGLRALGWVVTAIEDVYDKRAEDTPDEDWIEHGSALGWALLTKDKWIRRRPAYDRASVPIFALSNGNLTNRAMVDRFDGFRARIWAEARKGRREFWMVYETSIDRRDP